jgi:hypothetical protein
MVMQYPSSNVYICYGAKGFLIYPKRGIACALNNFGHKQYPSNNLDQNNSIHGVYISTFMRILLSFLSLNFLFWG